MRTKLIRLNKLPRLDGTGEEDGKDVKSTPKESFGVTSSAFKKGDTSKYGQFLDIFDNLMKKSIKQVREFQLEARDRSVIIDLPESQTEGRLDDELLCQWITDVCNNVFSSAFHSFSNDDMTYEQTKIFCSEGILKNIVLLTKRYELDQRQIQIINKHIEERIVPYMQRKYPLTESSGVNKAIDERVKPIDNREALQNDLLQKSGVVFTYRQDGNYDDLIMKFLNWLMTEIDTTPQNTKITVYEQFYDFVSDMFERVTDQTWMNQRSVSLKTITQLKEKGLLDNKAAPPNEKQKSVSIKTIAQSKEKGEKAAQDVRVGSGAEREKYAAKVKEYTHYAIGRKISKNVQVYTEEQLNSGHLIIKSPSILRILTKWCEELWDKFKTKNYFIDREENLRVQEKGGNVNTMFMWMKLPLNDLIEIEKKLIQDFMKDIQKNNFDQQSRLLLIQLQRDGFTHIEKYEKACGKFSYKVVNNLHRYIVLYLNRIIHGLLKVSKELYDTKLSTKARWTSPPDLLSFKIGDLMRCKCSSKEREILKIFQYLEEFSVKHPTQMKIIRVKNRLKLGTNDILINTIYKQKYLCEIQLAVKSITSKFIQCSNLFSHYVYQLGRTLFGPLTELCSVWTSLDPRAIEYLNLIKNQTRVVSSEAVGCKKDGKQHKFTDLDRPFICSNCHRAYSHTNYISMHQKCDPCGFLICGLCLIENQDTDKLKSHMLQYESKQLQDACKFIVNRKSEAEKIIPQYGICVQIESKKIKAQKFRKLQIKRIMTLYGLAEDKKTKKEKVYKIDDLVKRDAQKRFLRKYIVFQIPYAGEKFIKIDIDRAKKQYIIPEKVKDIYKKQQQILSLIDENLDSTSISIMKGSVQGMAAVANMQLADNKLTDIKFITEFYPNLDRLQLSRNKLVSVETIDRLTKMKKLNLRNNKLTVLPDQICNLSQLQGLNIRQNQILALPENFGNLVKLKKLQSDKNFFKDLPSSFQKLVSLTFLDLSGNKLTVFPAAIRNFKKLKELALAKNNLGQAPDWLGQLSEIISLDLSKTGLKNFPVSILGLKKLQTFKIQSLVDSISPQIGNLPSLKTLCIKMPNLKALPNEMSKLTDNLQVFELQDCKMSALPDWLSELKKLQTFSLMNNCIDSLDDQITEMVSLKYLNIEGQNIKSLPSKLQNLIELRTLSLDNNNFTNIPQAIRSFPKLYSLSMRNNNIVDVAENCFQKLIALQTALLDENNIKFMPSSVGSLKRLKQISLHNNNLEKLENSLFINLPGLETLWLHKNKLKELPIEIANLQRLKQIKYDENLLTMDADWLEKVKKKAEENSKLGLIDDFNFRKNFSNTSSDPKQAAEQKQKPK